MPPVCHVPPRDAIANLAYPANLPPARGLLLPPRMANLVLEELTSTNGTPTLVVFIGRPRNAETDIRIIGVAGRSDMVVDRNVDGDTALLVALCDAVDLSSDETMEIQSKMVAPWRLRGGTTRSSNGHALARDVKEAFFQAVDGTRGKGNLVGVKVLAPKLGPQVLRFATEGSDESYRVTFRIGE